MSDLARYDVGPRLSEVAEFKGVLYLAGQVAENCDGDIRAQTREVLASIEKTLTRHWSSKDRILQCQIYLANKSDFEAMNEVWDRWVTPGATPPRATLQAGFFRDGRLIEIVVIAACRS